MMASQNEQQVFGNLLEALRLKQQAQTAKASQALAKRQQLTAERKQELLERGFAEELFDTRAKRAAIERLSNLTPETIGQASAKDLATIQNSSISGMLSAYLSTREASRKTSDKAFKPPTKLVEYAAVQRQARELGVPEAETPLWQFIRGSSKEKSEKQIRQEIAKKIATDVVFTGRSKEEKSRLVDEAMDIVRGAERTRKVKLDSLLERTIEEFQKQRPAATFEEAVAHERGQ